MTDSSDARLRHGYRAIRLVSGERESPWPGELLAAPSGEPVLSVDADRLGAAWPGWDADPGGHVLAPRDILRRPDGHDVLFPVCSERLEDFMSRRAGTAGDLSPGEAVTIAVSVLRGVAELGREGDDVSGAWWLTADGCPVYATGAGPAGVREQTVAVLRGIATDVPGFAEALTGPIEAVSDPGRRSRQELSRAEDALFALADPLALATTTFGPRRARDRALEGAGDLGTAEPSRTPWALSLARHLDGEWADLVSRTTTGLWRALRAPRPSRRRPWLVAGAAAAVVLIGGVLWPSGDDGPATAVGAPATVEESTAPTAPTASRTAAAPTGGAPPTSAAPSLGQPPAAADSDIETVTDALLTRRATCHGDSTCLDAVLEATDATLPPGASDLAAGQRELALLDEFGGAAVLRVDAHDAATAPQLVVVVRKNGTWLIRDIFDVAAQ